MKAKMFKKLTSMATAALVAASTAIPMFSVTAGATDGEVTMDSTGHVTSSANVLVIPKTITMFNTDDSQYCSVVVNYNFTVEPDDPPADAVVGAVKVKRGIAGSLAVTQQPSFIQELVSMTSSGADSTKNMKVTVDTTMFEKAGVYRYKITDNTAISELFKVGITRNKTDNTDYQTTRWLDVFITKTDDTCSVSGYVLMKNNPISNESSVIQKSAGFVRTDSLGYDSYRTYNVRLEKKVEGKMADAKHEFPFAISINNTDGNNVKKKYFYQKNGTTGSWTSSTIDSSTQGDGTVDLTQVDLKNGDVIYIRGLIPTATVNYTETNDTADTYTVKVTGRIDPNDNSTLTTIVDEIARATDETTTTGAQAITNYAAVNSASNVGNATALTSARDVVFVNKIDAISPTGLVLRFGAFALIAGFGVFFLIVSRRSKAKKADTDII